MDLLQVLINVEKHVSEARTFYKGGYYEEVADELADAAGLIQREIADKVPVKEEPEIEEEQPTPIGHCVPDQVREAQTESEETKQETSEGTPANQE